MPDSNEKKSSGKRIIFGILLFVFISLTCTFIILYEETKKELDISKKVLSNCRLEVSSANNIISTLRFELIQVKNMLESNSNAIFGAITKDTLNNTLYELELYNLKNNIQKHLKNTYEQLYNIPKLSDKNQISQWELDRRKNDEHFLNRINTALNDNRITNFSSNTIISELTRYKNFINGLVVRFENIPIDPNTITRSHLMSIIEVLINIYNSDPIIKNIVYK